jgi:membrane protein implicated in regulation of membrane protease activity
MIIYAALGAAGLLLLFVMLIASSFGDHDVPIHEGSFDHGDLDTHAGGPSPLGTRVIAAFLVFFGVGGIVGQHLGWSHPVSSAFGVALGFIGATMVHRFASLLYSQQASSSIGPADLIARPAQITVAIPENGIGEVSLVVGVEETTQLARSADGKPIDDGAEVVIKAVRGSQVIVERKF